ncbi:MAG: hypothetical protein ACKPCP_17015 [Sphaerospermopsis kisseleviana]
MNVMGSLYPETNNTSNNKASSKASMLLGTENETLSNYAAIPKSVSEKDVVELAKKSGDLEANIELMKLWSEQSLNVQTSALTALDTRINHASQSLKNQQNFKKKMGKHGKDISLHNLVNQVTQSNYDGFQMALNNATETIAI